MALEGDHALATAAAELMDRLETHYPDGRVGHVLIAVEVYVPDDEEGERIFTHTRSSSSDPVVQRGQAERALEAVVEPEETED